MPQKQKLKLKGNSSLHLYLQKVTSRQTCISPSAGGLNRCLNIKAVMIPKHNRKSKLRLYVCSELTFTGNCDPNHCLASGVHSSARCVSPFPRPSIRWAGHNSTNVTYLLKESSVPLGFNGSAFGSTSICCRKNRASQGGLDGSPGCVHSDLPKNP